MAQRVLTAGWQTVTYATPQVVWVVKGTVRKAIGALPTSATAGELFLGPEVVAASTLRFQGPGVLDEYAYNNG
mgnify:CR=1 FL=1